MLYPRGEKPIWRKVVGRTSYRYYKAHGDTVVLELECGHEVSRKASEVPKTPKRVMCPLCRAE